MFVAFAIANQTQREVILILPNRDCPNLGADWQRTTSHGRAIEGQIFRLAMSCASCFFDEYKGMKIGGFVYVVVQSSLRPAPAASAIHGSPADAPLRGRPMK